MANPMTVSREGNAMRVIMDDGTEFTGVPTGYGYWSITASGKDPDPEPSVFKYPFPRSQHTSYPGHSGTDWPGGVVGNSAPIKAIGPGVVSETYDYATNTSSTAEPIWRGICVVIDHGVIDGIRISSLYAHMSSRAVNKDDVVSGGQVIGIIGNTGRSDGTHLHFEVDAPNRRPTNSVPSGYTVTMDWLDAHTDGSSW